MPDIYDEEVKRLTDCPRDISHAWNAATPLFAFVGILDGKHFGCLTEIKARPDCFKTNNPLINQIINDDRIPTNVKEIKVEHLPLFAEYQRIIDKKIRSKI